MFAFEVAHHGQVFSSSWGISDDIGLGIAFRLLVLGAQIIISGVASVVVWRALLKRLRS